MTHKRDAANSVVANGTTRFSLLTPRLIRMEYSRQGAFEDRPTVRAISRPDPLPFEEVETDDKGARLAASGLIVERTENGENFTGDNLKVLDRQSGKVIWTPETVDKENLGGVHRSQDRLSRAVIPAKVKDATTEEPDYSRGEAFKFLKATQSHTPLPSDGRPQLDNLEGLQEELDYMKRTQILGLISQIKDEHLPRHMTARLREHAAYPPGLLSRAGFYLYNDSRSPTYDPEARWLTNQPRPEGIQDYYLFVYGHDYQAALKDYMQVFGRMPLLPRYALGLWYSRYPTFDEPTLRELVEEFERRNLPLDVLVLDLEWHRRGWHGFDWDTGHIHNPQDFLDFLKERQIHTTFNVHPNAVPVEDSRFEEFLEKAEINQEEAMSNLTSRPQDTDEIKLYDGFRVDNRKHAEAFMDVLHKPVQDMGMDFWWIDGAAKTEDPELNNQLWTNHVYYKHIKDNYNDRRPMIFSRQPGFGAHRYPMHFTGDAYQQWEVLENQVEQTIRAGHIGQSYVTHDIAGHMGPYHYVDPELYCRWVQFAVLSPMIRLHSSGGGERRPWMYGNNELKIFKQAIGLRMELLPYLYSIARESVDTCMPMCRSMFIIHPEWEPAYELWTQYYLGDRILAAPVVSPGATRDVLLPEGEWYCSVSGNMISSDGKSDFTQIARAGKGPLYYTRAGSVVVKQPYTLKAQQIPETLVLEVYSTEANFSDSFCLYEDDGITQNYNRSEYSKTRFKLSGKDGELSLKIEPVEGSFDGLPEPRNYILRLIGKEPTEVTCGDSAIQSSEDDESRCVKEFRLGALSGKKEHRILIR
jgi:alpha-glucosidase (family GH31 glycosyl hydrolase)